jgi:hypothetical protein
MAELIRWIVVSYLPYSGPCVGPVGSLWGQCGVPVGQCGVPVGSQGVSYRLRPPHRLSKFICSRELRCELSSISPRSPRSFHDNLSPSARNTALYLPEGWGPMGWHEGGVPWVWWWGPMGCGGGVPMGCEGGRGGASYLV